MSTLSEHGVAPVCTRGCNPSAPRSQAVSCDKHRHPHFSDHISLCFWRSKSFPTGRLVPFCSCTPTLRPPCARHSSPHATPVCRYPVRGAHAPEPQPWKTQKDRQPLLTRRRTCSRREVRADHLERLWPTQGPSHGRRAGGPAVHLLSRVSLRPARPT